MPGCWTKADARNDAKRQKKIDQNSTSLTINVKMERLDGDSTERGAQEPKYDVRMHGCCFLYKETGWILILEGDKVANVCQRSTEMTHLYM